MPFMTFQPPQESSGEGAVLPENNVTGTGVTHIWAGPDGTIPAEQDDDTIYFEFTQP